MNETSRASTGGLTELLFHEPGAGRCLVAADGRVLRVNAEWLRSTGLTLTEVLGRNVLDLLPNVREVSIAHVRARAGQRVEVPRQRRRIGGRETWWEETIAPVPVNDGTGLLIITREVRGDSERVVTQTSACAEQTADHAAVVREGPSRQEQFSPGEQLSKIAESVPGVICSYRLRADGSTCMPFATAAVQDLYGIPREVLANDLGPWAANVHAEDLQRVQDKIAEAARTLSRWHDEFRYRHPAKGLRWIEGWSSPVREADGSIVWHGYVTDVTDRKQAEVQLKASEMKFRGVFENAFEFVGLVDLDGRLLAANPSSLRFAGVQEQNVLGRLFWETPWWSHDPREQARLREAVAAAAAGELVRYEATNRSATGALHEIDFSIKRVSDGAGLPALLVVEGRDVSDFRRAEREGRRLEERLRQAQRMESIGRLAAGVAHDFNNLLTGILSGAEHLRRELAVAGRLQEVAEAIREEALRASGLTRQLLAFARKEPSRALPVDVHLTVHDVVSLLSHGIDKRISLRSHLAATSAVVRGDPDRLHAALLNLALNARDAMPEGGTLTFETRDVDLGASECEALPSRLVPGPHLEVRVCDTGVGLSADAREHLFEPFFTTKPPGKGSGLGLAEVYGTVQAHRGAVTVESQAGRGTVVTLFLPASAERPPDTRAPDGGRHRVPSLRVLVVDDEPHVRRSLRRLLEARGHAVVECCSGYEAVERYRTEWRDIDVVVLDMIMPDMNGRDVFRHLRSSGAQVPVIVSSGFSAGRDLEALRAEPSVIFLDKPYTVDDLERALAAAAGGRKGARGAQPCSRP